MDRRGALGGIFGAAIALGINAIFSQTPEEQKKFGGQAACPPQYKDSDWAFMKKTYLTGAEQVNSVLRKEDQAGYAPLETNLSSRGAGEQLKALDKLYGQFVEQGKISDQGNLWQDIRKSLHTAELAEINAKYDCKPPAGPRR